MLENHKRNFYNKKKVLYEYNELNKIMLSKKLNLTL